MTNPSRVFSYNSRKMELPISLTLPLFGLVTNKLIQAVGSLLFVGDNTNKGT
jgi:hypothetical protein